MMTVTRAAPRAALGPPVAGRAHRPVQRLLHKRRADFDPGHQARRGWVSALRRTQGELGPCCLPGRGGGTLDGVVVSFDEPSEKVMHWLTHLWSGDNSDQALLGRVNINQDRLTRVRRADGSHPGHDGGVQVASTHLGRSGRHRRRFSRTVPMLGSPRRRHRANGTVSSPVTGSKERLPRLGRRGGRQRIHSGSPWKSARGRMVVSTVGR
jgi:hypothetical protein